MISALFSPCTNDVPPSCPSPRRRRLDLVTSSERRNNDDVPRSTPNTTSTGGVRGQRTLSPRTSVTSSTVASSSVVPASSADGFFGPYAVAVAALEAEIDAAESRIVSSAAVSPSAEGGGSAVRASVVVRDSCTATAWSWVAGRGGRRSVTGSETARAAAPLLDMLSSEISRIEECASAEGRMLERSARSLLASADATLLRRDSSVGESNSTSMDEESVAITLGRARALRERAAGISARSLALNHFVANSAVALRTIAHEADERIGTSCLALVEPQLASPAWGNVGNAAGGAGSSSSVVLAILSDAYDAINNAEEIASRREEELTTGHRWVAPAVFERTTCKFWVMDGDAAEVLHAVVAELPLLVYGRTGRLTPHDPTPSASAALAARSSNRSDLLWDSLATPVSSVYLESPDLTLYRDRLARNEGARLLRARWYGHERPSGDEIIFLERKTHHEKWTDEKSVKERVSICEKDMIPFLDTNVRWDEATAEAVVLDAAGESLKGEKLQKSKSLLLEMKQMVNDLKLRPSVRTKYLRAAFQSPRSNSLRVTFDRMVTLIDEKCGNNSSSKKDWCLSDDESIDPSSVVHLPRAVLEVKVARGDGIPDFVQRLIDTGAVDDGHKFSKYLTGTAAFNAVPSLPYWAENPVFAPLFNRNNDGDMDANNRTGDFSKEQDDHSLVRSVDGCVKRPLAVTATAVSAAAVTSSTTRSFRGTKMGTSSDRNKGGRGRSLVDGILLCSCLGTGKKSHGNDGKPTSAFKRPARVEPKSYFANERTFIQWITAALWLVTISLILLEMAVTHSGVVGLVLIVVAMVVSVYALWTYFRRVRLMQERRPYGYVDHTAPVVLTLSFMAGMFVLIYFTYLERTAATGTTTFQYSPQLAEAPGCIRHGINGISTLEYQPSDVLMDESRGLLLVPSLSLITAVPVLDANEPVSSRERDVLTVADIPGSEIEGLTYVGDTLYAISEKSKSSELFALEWDAGRTALSIIGQWTIPTPGAEGIAYVPSVGGGKLYISGDELAQGGPKDTRALLHIYDVPALTSSGQTLSPVGRLNTKLMTEGLEDNKISSMYFFDELQLLFLLHDNASLIRAWNITSGSFYSEWTVPSPPGSRFNGQWEGLALQRTVAAHDASTDANQAASANLRGFGAGAASSPNLLLHLALDTPPQVWSIALNEESHSFAMSLPACATGRAGNPQ